MKFIAWCALAWILAGASTAYAQTTAFTFQGKLTDAGNPANGNYDLQLKLFDTAAVGSGVQKGVTVLANPVAATAGVFSVALDFGAAPFDGADRFLEIGVRPSGSAAAYTVLSPRSAITSAPYSIQAINAQLLGGLPASSYISTGSVGNAFVKNDTALQTATNFNIDGKGLVGTSLGIATVPVVGVALDVLGSARFAPGNGGTTSLGAPNGEVGLTTVSGSGRADLRFDGTAVKLVAGPVGGPPPSTNGVAVTTEGRVFVNQAAENGVAVRMAIEGGTDEALFVQNGASVNPTVEVLNRGAGAGIQSTGGIGVLGSGTVSPSSFGVFSNGYMGVNQLGSAGNTALCLNASNQIATCSSSLRYKQDLQPFDAGLRLLDQLHPIAFRWIADQLADVGFGAEDVARVNPLFVTYDKSGAVEGVKYDRLSVVFVNAIKEQQAQIQSQAKQLEEKTGQLEAQAQRLETLQERLERQQRQLDALQRLACESRSDPATCEEAAGEIQ